MSEYLQLPEGRDRRDDFWADLWIMSEGVRLLANAYIFAPGRGDEIFAVLQKKLQELANQRNIEVVHEFFPANNGSRALIERIGGYERRVYETGCEVYERTYKPE